eukprot:gnl/TRDRNA2_/TRDRNA2_180226_c0_seq1.p1 gnl/TRDRNA2_/TRDRNA2_180226_c0~~gnl/TRDRNA2_/TRDRNA2_180226_c0_seq1.p1  ORF type:complete len:804 (+),score=236.88 gnl/TRDRNA2_/TRDRNA2_180226_c0_seq1:125-2413(+)
MALQLRRSELLKKCIEVIETFDPKRTTVDAYAEDCPILKDKHIGEVEQKFIHQVFYGCIRYQKFLKLFVTSFLYKCPAMALRCDQTLYIVLAYLLFFRLEELGVEEYRQFLVSGCGTMPALMALLQYCLSEEELNRWVKIEWCKVYDQRYIEQEVIGKLQGMKSELQPLMDEIEYKATGTVTATEEGGGFPVPVKKVTEPMPFNLTKPKPRLIPEPEVISREIKANPVNPVIFTTTLAQVEAEKQERREELKAKTMAKHSEHKGPDLKSASRPRVEVEKEELTRQAEERLMGECSFQPTPAKPYKPPTADAPIKQNASSVLREDALLKKKQAKEYEILKRYEEDLHDPSGYYEWQANQREQDQLEEEKRVNMRKVEMQLARIEAMEAREGLERKNNILAQHQRAEGKELLRMMEAEQDVVLQGKRQLVADTAEERDNARFAEEEIFKEKCKRAEELRKAKEAEFERKKREDEQEMVRKRDLIQQIQALERVPVERFKMFDPAEPPCWGLLEEMSLSELRERMKIAQAQHNKEVEDKRERQLEKKHEKQVELTEKVETLAKVREIAKVEAHQRHVVFKQRKVEEEERKQKYREQCIEQCAEKIAKKKQQKRAEEQALRKELKEISTKRQFLQANADMVEAKAHGEQQMGLEREARVRQVRTLAEQRAKNTIHGREVSIRNTNKMNEEEKFRQMQAAVNDRLQRAKAEDLQLKQDLKTTIRLARDLGKADNDREFREYGASANKYMQRVASRNLEMGMSQSVTV